MMGKYIALLRGINVGGKNKISMKELKAVFEDIGFEDVATYINSGNIVFSSSNADESELKRKCESAITDSLGLDISVGIISARDLSDALRNAPNWWGVESQSKHNAIFIIPPATAEEVIRQVGETKPEEEQIAYSGQVIFWSAPIETFSITRWSKIVGSSAYKNITIRNANTARKLLQLAE